MGSDFGRTNFYNAADGKDHWPYGSYIVMEKNQRWTGRVVGETDELHFPLPDRSAHAGGATRRTGTLIYPKHVHKALRRLPRHREHGGGAAVSVQQHRGLCVFQLALDGRPER